MKRALCVRQNTPSRHRWRFDPPVPTETILLAKVQNAVRHLDKVPGFVEFHLLKGPEVEDHTLYASHRVWKNRATFEAWTKSEAFRAAHASAGGNKPLCLGHPQFEGFETIQTVGSGKTKTA